MAPEEVKQQAIAILQDIVKFWQPKYGDIIIQEFENRLNKI